MVGESIGCHKSVLLAESTGTPGLTITIIVLVALEKSAHEIIELVRLLVLAIVVVR